MTHIEYILNECKQLGISSHISPVVDNEKFHRWPASIDKHHADEGGLLRHTYEVLKSSLNMAKMYSLSTDDKQILAVSAVWHDYGKLWDYVWYNDIDKWKKSDHNRNIHHLPRSTIEWNKHAADNGENNSWFTDEVTHCILSHHQLRQWGSNVFPNSKPAWILHCCDNISARMDDYDKISIPINL